MECPNYEPVSTTGQYVITTVDENSLRSSFTPGAYRRFVNFGKFAQWTLRHLAKDDKAPGNHRVGRKRPHVFVADGAKWRPVALTDPFRVNADITLVAIMYTDTVTNARIVRQVVISSKI